MPSGASIVEDFLRTQGEITKESPSPGARAETILTIRHLAFDTRTLIQHVDPSDFDVQQAEGLLRDFSSNREALHLNALLVVAPEAVENDVAEHLKRDPNVRYITINEMVARSIDFVPYLRSLVDSWEKRRDGISNYYVPLSTVTGKTLDDHIAAWVAGDDPTPIAILGSYGIGKSVFASKLARDLADANLRSPSSRIPVLIRLGEVSHEQSLEGLLGSTLTTGDFARNFSFQAFQHLNRAGRTVVILDGFDEMKRGMTWEIFRYNLSQLNRLVDGDSRVILLGRPTAFMDESEVLQALHGKRYFAGQFFMDPDWPDYQEISIALLDNPKIDLYCDQYLKYRASTEDERNDLKIRQRIERTQNQVKDASIHDIAARPVQLKMLLDVLPDWTKSLKELGLAELYAHFIENNISREAERPTRARYGVKQRHRFARELAWWMWTRPREQTSTSNVRISATEIPESLLTNFVNPGDDIEVARRDLVAACFLDKKRGGDLVFPHRSFQEFLVAEHLYAIFTQRNEEINLDPLLPHITAEVADFLVELIGPNVPETLDKALVKYSGTLPWHLLRVWAQSSGQESIVRQRIRKEGWSRTLSGRHGAYPWWSLIASIAYCSGAFRSNPEHLIFNRLKGSSGYPKDAALYLFCLLVIAKRTGDYGVASQALMSACELGSTYEIYSDSRPSRPHKVIRSWRDHGATKMQIFEPPQGMPQLLRSLSITTRKGVRHLNVRSMRPHLVSMLRGYVFISEFYKGEGRGVGGVAFPESVPMRDDSAWELISQYQKDFASFESAD